MSKGCHDHQSKALVSSITVSEVKTPCVEQSETAVLVLEATGGKSWVQPKTEDT